MLIGFICPDGAKILTEDCFKKCRMEERCLTLPTLKLIAQQRDWSGVASTTQMLNGTMLAWLSLTQDYYCDPDKRAFMLAGTRHHAGLEAMAKELGLPAEIALSVDRDIFDLLEPDKDGGYVLTDYKMFGSYKLAKVLGIVEDGKMADPSGEVYRSSGKWGMAGSPKMIKRYTRRPDLADNWEAELQQNRYRIKLQQLASIVIKRMQLQVTVRDGGLYIAKQRGVYKNIYRIPVTVLPDQQVTDYFDFKETCLKEAMGKNIWNIPCSERESWEGLRCQRYCDVAEFCPRGRELMKREAIE